MSHRGNLPYRPLKVCLTEEITGACKESPSDKFLVGKRITVYDNVVECGLLTLYNSHLNIYRITLYSQLYRHYVKEEITVVRIHLPYIGMLLLRVSLQPLLHCNHIIYVALLYAKHTCKLGGGVDGVTCPGYIPEEIFASHINVKVYLEPVVRDIVDGILNYSCIAVTPLLQHLKHKVLIVIILLLVKFLGVEEVAYALVSGLLHCLLELPGGDSLISLYVNSSNLYFRTFGNLEGYPHSIFDYRICLLNNLYVCLQKTLLLEEPLDNVHR